MTDTISPEEIAAHRAALELTIKDASTLSGVKESAIRSIEKGKTPHGAQTTVDKYVEWIEEAASRAKKKGKESPLLRYPAKAFGSEPVLDDDGVQIKGMWITKDRGLGQRYVMQYPTDGQFAGWEPGRKFRVEGEAGTFQFQRLTVHATTGGTSVDAYGGPSNGACFRSFFPEKVLS